MSIRRSRGRLVVEFQFRGRRIFKRLPDLATEEDAKALEDKWRRQIFIDSDFDGRQVPVKVAQQQRIDPNEWAHAAALLLAAGPIGPRSGVYFLCNRGKLVYVGQSRNVAKRLAGHMKQYSHVSMVDVPPSRLAMTEEYLIRLLQPRLNVKMNRDGKKIPAKRLKFDGMPSPLQSIPDHPCLAGPVAQSVRAGDS